MNAPRIALAMLVGTTLWATSAQSDAANPCQSCRQARQGYQHYSGRTGINGVPTGRSYYNGRYYGNFNNRFYGPQYGYF